MSVVAVKVDEDNRVNIKLEELNKMIDDATEHYAMTNNGISFVNRWIRERKMRKQICDEIRIAFREKCKNTFAPNPNMVDFITLHIGDVEEFLDKVEEGEEV